jgi:hypothetical protein
MLRILLAPHSLTPSQRRIVANVRFYAGFAALFAVTACAVLLGAWDWAIGGAFGIAAWMAVPVAVEMWRLAGEDEE